MILDAKANYTPPDDSDGPKYQVGQLVHHVRYDYRGVIVARDQTCQADEGWYLKNKTQPAKDQPWYHVLVDGSVMTTYAAQTSLEPDRDGGAVNHPMVPVFFASFSDGRYQRNDEPWPG